MGNFLPAGVDHRHAMVLPGGKRRYAGRVLKDCKGAMS
jgi:hypothetical protein